MSSTLVQRAVLPLRLVLILGFALLLLLQTFSLPGQFAHMAQEDPDAEAWRWPLTAFAAVLLLCVQVVVVCTWKLLTMVKEDRIFSDRALVWVDVIIGAIGTACVLLTGLLVALLLTYDDPGLPILTCLVLVAGTAVGLLVFVMRSLLVQATTLRTDMEAVI